MDPFEASQSHDADRLCTAIGMGYGLMISISMWIAIFDAWMYLN